MKNLNPNYKVPCRNTFGNSILNKLYEKIHEQNSSMVSNSSVLVLDVWKNKQKIEKYVVGLVHNANGERSSLNSWDLTQQGDTDVALKKSCRRGY